MTGQLANADLNPPAMPPSAVLIVRRLSDPLPHRFTRGRIRPHPDWERAVQAQLAECYRKAARPAAGWIDPNAEAVLFRDESEWLACLALDIAGGRHLRHWWWRRMLRDLSLSAYSNPLAALLQGHPRELPALLAWLSAWEHAETVLGTLTVTEVTVVWRALVQAHALNTALLPSPMAKPPDNRSYSYDIPEPGRLSAEVTRVPQRSPPWLAWLADPPRTLTPEQAYLLGLGLALHHIPSQVRSRLFAAQVRGWWQEWASGPETGKNPMSAPIAGNNLESSEPASTAHDWIRSPEAGKNPMSAPVAGNNLESSEPASTVHDQKRLDEASGKPPEYLSARSIQILSDESPPRRETKAGITFLNPPPPGGDHERTSHGTPAEGTPQSHSMISPTPAVIFRETYPLQQSNTVQTQEDLAEDSEVTTERLENGIFTNLGGILYLINLFDHLDLPESVEPGWSLLDALARALLGEALAQYSDDSIWRVLARLDGRDPDIPPELDKDPSRWLTQAVPSIHLRLQQALAVDTAISDALLPLPGWLYVTPSHMDLVTSLESISLPVRRAGLDRDPGWVAGLGRVVAFHFQ